MNKKLEAMINSLDYEKIHSHMKSVNWTWAEIGVPSPAEIKRTATQLVQTVIDGNDSTSTTTGGLVVTKIQHKDENYYSLSFCVCMTSAYIELKQPVS